MSLKDIEKLKEKVDRDPSSKLFVPLAEEYRKEGLLDEAIGVLLNGLETQPNYMSARVSLGKIYLEKGMFDEARSEFENVVHVIPDNLYAHKKLAEMYRDTGERDLAVKSLRTVLRLNPMDEDALNKLREIEGTGREGVPFEKPGETKEVLPDRTDFSQVTVAPGEAMQPQRVANGEPTDLPEELPSDEEISVETSPDDELASFKSAIFGVEDNEAENLPDELPVSEEETMEIVDESSDESEEISFDDLEDLPQGDEADLAVETEDIEGFADREEALGAESPDEKTSPSLGDGLEDADRFIAEGKYSEAMTVYRDMLVANPDDRSVLQRVEDLRTLFKLLGKDKEVLIARLNMFLEGINKRRDELYRST